MKSLTVRNLMAIALVFSIQNSFAAGTDGGRDPGGGAPLDLSEFGEPESQNVSIGYGIGSTGRGESYGIAAARCALGIVRSILNDSQYKDLVISDLRRDSSDRELSIGVFIWDRTYKFKASDQQSNSFTGEIDVLITKKNDIDPRTNSVIPEKEVTCNLDGRDFELKNQSGDVILEVVKMSSRTGML